MLIVRPNPRRMRAFLDSPAEGSRPLRPGFGMGWERMLLAIGAVGAVAAVVITLALH